MSEDKQTEIKNIVTLEDCGPCKKKVIIEIPAEAIAQCREEQYADLSKDAVVPGFRKGRAPMRLLEKRFGSDVDQQVKVKLLADASESAVKDSEIDMLGDPNIDYEKIELPESGSMTFDFEVEVKPEFDLPEIEGMEIDKPKIEADKSKVDEEIAEICKRSGIWEVKDGPVVEGDRVVANVLMNVSDVDEAEKKENVEISAITKGYVGGIPFENLNEILAGAKPGDVKTANTVVSKTFHNEQYRGKTVDVELTIKDVKNLVPAELNEELLTKFGLDSEDDLREKIVENMEQTAEREARTAMCDQVYKQLLASTDFDLPESFVADQSVRILQRQYSNMMMQGLSKEQLEEEMKNIQASSEDQAKEQLQLFFIMDKIADKLEVSVEEGEINGHIAMIAAQRGRRPEKMREEMVKDGSLSQFAMQVREQKCVDKILETAKITDVDAADLEKKTAAKKTAKKKTAKKATAKKATAKKTESDSEAKPAAKKTAKKAVKKTAKKTTAKKTDKK